MFQVFLISYFCNRFFLLVGIKLQDCFRNLPKHWKQHHRRNPTTAKYDSEIVFRLKIVAKKSRLGYFLTVMASVGQRIVQEPLKTYTYFEYELNYQNGFCMLSRKFRFFLDLTIFTVDRIVLRQKHIYKLKSSVWNYSINLYCLGVTFVFSLLSTEIQTKPLATECFFIWLNQIKYRFV